MKNVRYTAGLVAVSIFVGGCGQGFQSATMASVAGEINNGATCPNAREKIFETYHRAYADADQLDDSNFKSALQAKLKTDAAFAKAGSVAQTRYEKSLEGIHSILTTGLREVGNVVNQTKMSATGVDGYVPEDEDSRALHLARLEMRSRLEPQYDELNKKLDAALAESASAGQEIGITCADPADPIDTTVPDATEASENTEVATALSMKSPIYGALYTMATAYQSCSVLDLQPVTSSTTATQGVVRGSKVDKVGYGRVYTDLGLLKRTHYYHRGQSYGAGCADQSKKPMVYDYGGVPVVGSVKLDMFTNAGGGPAMGIDCSAFVSTAASVAGNLYKPATSKAPVYRRFVSRDFINPAKSGWTCYDSVKPSTTASIAAGDIAAIAGHVVMVDRVGADPFGLSKIKTSAACGAMTVRNFDFTVVQSSPEKGSIGINRFASRDYLANGGTMAKMFLAYGKAACLTKFDGKTRNPVASNYGIIRHKQTASCTAQRKPLVNESCVANCSTWKDFATN